MFIDSLCGPSIVYIGFSILQIIIDIYKNLYGDAFIKFLIMIILSIVLNILCNMGLSIIAWFLVFIPIIMMSVISVLLLHVFKNKNNIKNINLKDKKRKNENKNSIKKEKNLSIGNSNQYSSKRLNRDIQREELYEKINDYYNLNKNEETNNKENSINYNIYDALINWFGEKYFNININKSL